MFMTQFEKGLKKLEMEKLVWCIEYLEKNGDSFPNTDKVNECIETMKKEIKNRKQGLTTPAGVWYN